MLDFDDLQDDFVRRFGGDFGELENGTIVVVSSITFAPSELRKITGIEHYEERLLCVLLWLRNPATRIVYVSSVEVDPAIVDYYLSFLPDPEDARRRLTMISLGDPQPRALTEKLLERPEVVAEIRRAVPDPAHAFIMPFNVTELERALAELMGLPLYGPRPDLARFGTKSGGRSAARRAGVPVLEGAEDLRSLDDLEAAIASLRARRPEARAVVIKLNNGFSGQGNAIIDVKRVAAPIDHSVTVFCAEDESWASFGPKILDEGAIVEEQLRVAGLVSPSVQLRIDPGGGVEVISTHDQILGGPDDQVYLGCRFPARRDYRRRIQDHALRIAELLAAEGVIGLFGIDFVAVPGADGYVVYLSEINLRVGGTTHPFLMAKGVSGGTYDAATGELRADGRNICYVASDNIKSPRYVGITPDRVLRALRASGLAYDDTTKSGATLHLLGALEGYGKLGATCLAPTIDEAAILYDEVVAMLDGSSAS